MIELKNLCAGYYDDEILHNISLNLKKGKITGIIGANGCGKSTLLKTIVRLTRHISGEIIIDGKSINCYNSAQLAQKIAYLPQNKSAPDMTVEQIVLHGRFPYLSYPRRYKKEDIDITHKVIKNMELWDIKDNYLRSLSGGQRQKTYIAMALVQQSGVILMDEPTTYLDIHHQLKLCENIKALANDGKTILLVLHDITLAMKLCDYICVMKDGNLLTYGTPQDVLETDCIKQAMGIKITKAEINGKSQYFYDL